MKVRPPALLAAVLVGTTAWAAPAASVSSDGLTPEVQPALITEAESGELVADRRLGRGYRRDFERFYLRRCRFRFSLRKCHRIYRDRRQSDYDWYNRRRWERYDPQTLEERRARKQDQWVRDRIEEVRIYNRGRFGGRERWRRRGSLRRQIERRDEQIDRLQDRLKRSRERDLKERRRVLKRQSRLRDRQLKQRDRRIDRLEDRLKDVRRRNERRRSRRRSDDDD